MSGGSTTTASVLTNSQVSSSNQSDSDSKDSTGNVVKRKKGGLSFVSEFTLFVCLPSLCCLYEGVFGIPSFTGRTRYQAASGFKNVEIRHKCRLIGRQEVASTVTGVDEVAGFRSRRISQQYVVTRWPQYPWHEYRSALHESKSRARRP